MMGLYPDEDLTVSVLEELKRTRFTLEDVQSPVPGEKVLKTLGRPKSSVGYFTLAGAIIGFFFGIGLSIYTAVQWGLVVSGKPVIALIPFFIVGFEFTVLFAVFGNILGILTQSRLPRLKPSRHHDPRCSGDRFGVLVSCARGQEPALAAFFKDRGGEVREF
jgi:molybdopterin-containing oxidoreductase family membrane subunit